MGVNVFGANENEATGISSSDVVHTLDKIENSLERVLFQSNDPVIVSINGGWGEGKTYFWKEYISRRHSNDKVIYVSVFGSGALKEIRQRVITAIFLRLDKLGSNLEKNRLMGLFKRFKEHSGSLLDNALKKFGLPDGLATQILESQILNSEMIICFDDIERLPECISTQEILGYLDELREDFNIKVVVIYNEDQLGKRKAEFESFHEKVIDRHLKFEPDLHAQVRRVLSNVDWISDIDDVYDDIAKRCNTLGFRNIRLLVKLKHFIQEVSSVLPENVDSGVKQNVVYSLLLFTWARYARNKDKPLVTFDFLREYSSIMPDLDDENDRGNEGIHKAREVLKEFGYLYTDDIDVVLMRYVETDILDDVKLNQCHDEAREHNSKSSIQSRFSGIWRNYFYNTFEDNTDELCEELINATYDYMPYASVFDVDGVMHLLRELGKNELASEIWGKFRDTRENTLNEIDNLFRHKVHTEEVKNLIEAVNSRTNKDTRSLSEVIESNKRHTYMTGEDRSRLIQFSSNDLADYFISLKDGDSVYELAGLEREAGRISNPDDSLLQIQAMAREAAEIILERKNTVINKVRLTHAGLIKDPEKSEVAE